MTTRTGLIAWNTVEVGGKGRQWPTLPGLKKSEWEDFGLPPQYSCLFIELWELWINVKGFEVKEHGKWKCIKTRRKEVRSALAVLVQMVVAAKVDAALVGKSHGESADEYQSGDDATLRNLLTAARDAGSRRGLIKVIANRIMALRLAKLEALDSI